MVSTQMKLALDAGAGAATGTAQFMLIKHYVDKASGAKPLFAAPSSLPGLGEYATVTSLAAGAVALGYELYKGEIKHHREITDLDMGIITYGITTLTNGIINMIIDPPDILGSVNPVMIKPQGGTVINPNQSSIYGTYSQ